MLSRRQVPGLILLPLFAPVRPAFAQEHRLSLVLAEFGEDSAGEQTQTLVRYHFRGGRMTSREVVLTTRTFDLRYDLSRNRIYNNRYVITEWGDIVDLVYKEALLKGRGRFVGVDPDSDSVILRIDRVDTEGTYAFSLRSRRYSRLPQLGRWALPGVPNPSRTRSAVGQGTEIWLHHPGGERALLGSDFLRGGTLVCSSFLTPIFLWLDDQRILTQRGDGHLVVLDIQGRVEPLVTIPNVKPLPCGPEIRRDGDGQIYYETAEGSWLIDIAERSASPYVWEALGNGFELAHERNSAGEREIRHRGKAIGQWWCSEAETAPGHIAVEFGPAGSNLGYPKGVKVWSAESGEWTSIEPDWLTALIGWTND